MKTLALFFLAAMGAAYAPIALAQSSCSSDGSVQPVTVFERFINADCAACWADARTPAPSSADAVVLDWIVPAASGDDAPLSAAARPEALARLQALGRTVPTETDVHVATVPTRNTTARSSLPLRVAHGLPFNDFIGTAIALQPPQQQRQRTGRGAMPNVLRYHLLLVETVPAGSDGTAVERQIVRNALEGRWDLTGTGRNNTSRKPVSEMRPMNIPVGAQAERLRVVGWVETADGQLVTAAQSTCAQ